MQPSFCFSPLQIFSLFVFIFFLIATEFCGAHSQNNCATYTAQYEKHHNIPEGLLQAISQVESGRKDGAGHLVAWPWAINVEGQGYYFPTKEAAIEAVRRFQNKGIKSIDVGCMQINLLHHPSAFASLQEAFDPEKNVAYGASFLSQLKKADSSWLTAVSHYHSANPIHHVSYQKNVLKQWGCNMKGERPLMAAVLHAAPLKVNRIRRLPTAHKAKFERGEMSSQGAVRRVTRFSPRLKRLSS